MEHQRGLCVSGMGTCLDFRQLLDLQDHKRLQCHRAPSIRFQASVKSGMQRRDAEQSHLLSLSTAAYRPGSKSPSPDYLAKLIQRILGSSPLAEEHTPIGPHTSVRACA